MSQRQEWIGPDGKYYRLNPLCQSIEHNCPGVCGYCLEYGQIDESLEIGAASPPVAGTTAKEK